MKDDMRLLPVLLALAACSGGSTSAPAPAPVPPPTPAPTSPIQLTAATHGTNLDLTLTNVSSAPFTLITHVEAEQLQWDDLTITLGRAGAGTGGDADGSAGSEPSIDGSRVFEFTLDRDKSIEIPATLAPGASDVEHIDLAAWALLQPDASPLAVGDHALHAVWSVLGRSDVAPFTASADATLTVAAPDPGSCARNGYQAPAGADLELLATQAPGGGARALIGLHNRGDVPICVWSHVSAGEMQSDWLTIAYSDGTKYEMFSRPIGFADARYRSARISVLLPPGATDWQTWDVAAWASRKRNGAEALASGSLWAQAIYESSQARGDDGAWQGRLTAQFGLTVP